MSKKKKLQIRNSTAEFLIFTNQTKEDGIEVRVQDETIWLSQKLMAALFDCSTDNISLHLKNIFKENELDEDSVTEEFSVTASDGKNYNTKHYNLDAIIAVGYRVNSNGQPPSVNGRHPFYGIMPFGAMLSTKTHGKRYVSRRRLF